MDQRAMYELESIKSELKSIINELENIESGLRRDFVNIGTEKAADCVLKAVNNYKTVKKKLDNINTEAVTDEYAEAHGVTSGGGGGGGGGGW